MSFISKTSELLKIQITALYLNVYFANILNTLFFIVLCLDFCSALQLLVKLSIAEIFIAQAKKFRRIEDCFSFPFKLPPIRLA